MHEQIVIFVKNLKISWQWAWISPFYLFVANCAYYNIFIIFKALFGNAVKPFLYQILLIFVDFWHFTFVRDCNILFNLTSFHIISWGTGHSPIYKTYVAARQLKHNDFFYLTVFKIVVRYLCRRTTKVNHFIYFQISTIQICLLVEQITS